MPYGYDHGDCSVPTLDPATLPPPSAPRRRFITRMVALAASLLAKPAAADDTRLPLLLAERHHAGIDPADYWVSEKLDGVRAQWDGEALRLRSGARIAAPEWFIAGLPAEALDGELWLGRRRFDELSGLIRRAAPSDPGWREVRYMVFELPRVSGDFSARVARMRELVVATDRPWLQLVEQFRVADHASLMRELERVVASGGEGLMLHRADAPVVDGRSSALLKLTPWQDAEARVTGYVAGKGRLTGQVGALIVETEDGRRFRIGSGLTDALRAAPPPVGTQITYRYRELTAAGMPRFPRFLRVRELP